MKSLFTLLLFIPIIGYSQYTKDEVISFLSDDSYKLWFFDRYESSMKGSDNCESGSAYTFYQDNKAEFKICVDGKWKKKNFTYSLEEESPFDWWITLDDKKYYLVMTNYEDYHEIKLRTKTGSRIDETMDIILKYYIDE